MNQWVNCLYGDLAHFFGGRQRLPALCHHSLPLRLRNRKSCCNLYISAPSRGMIHHDGHRSRSPSSCSWWLHGCTGRLPAGIAEPLLIDSVDCLVRRAARWTMRRPTGQTTLGGANSPGMSEGNAEGRGGSVSSIVFRRWGVVKSYGLIQKGSKFYKHSCQQTSKFYY